jgi:transcription antitermination factor NusG
MEIFKMKNNDDIKVGDRVKTVGGFFEGLEGIVTRVVEGVDEDEHGTIEVKATKVSHERYHYLEVGELEHFVHFGNTVLVKTGE